MSIHREGNPEGVLYGELIVFTGRLGISRRAAAAMAADIGCRVGSGVTKKTTLLVTGVQDKRRLAGHEKSSAHRKAEELIKQGVPIRILNEKQFKDLARGSGAEYNYLRQLSLPHPDRQRGMESGVEQTADLKTGDLHDQSTAKK